MKDMLGWHILITGGSSGIGLALAQAVTARGATVHLVARNPERLDAAIAQLGSGYIYPCDTALREARCQLIADVTRNTGGRLDALVVNAARYAYKHLLEEDDAVFEAYFQTNTVPAYHLVKLAHPLLLASVGKAVLFVSSSLGTRPVPGVGAYAASKAAMNSLAQTFALELAPDKIRVNALLPGVVNTPIHEPQTPEQPSRIEKLAGLAQLHPLGRVGDPHEVADAGAFLLSPQATWITGSLFAVDGGISLV